MINRTMKRLLICLIALIGILSAAAEQRSYVFIYAKEVQSLTNFHAKLSGDIPADLNRDYYGYEDATMGDVMNLLARHGFTVDQMSSTESGLVHIIMSRVAPEYPLQKYDVNDDAEVNVSDVNKEIDVVLDPSKYKAPQR